MEPSEVQLKRLNGSAGLPLWFAAPILAAESETRVSRRFLHVLARDNGVRIVFNVGFVETMLALVPCRYSIISLWQWRPLEQLPPTKRFVYTLLLGKSHVILTYSRMSEQYLRLHFPSKNVRWIGHFVDTDYWRGGPAGQELSEYILCPGDNSRIEKVVCKVAESLAVRVIRVSNDPAVEAFYERNPCALVTCKRNVSFDELRSLYRSCRAVINVADDRFWPVGITVFCEALAMNKTIITPDGHSCSGYRFDDGFRPYLTINDAFDANEWVAMVRGALKSPPIYTAPRSPRDLAIKFCSLSVMRNSWRETLRFA